MILVDCAFFFTNLSKMQETYFYKIPEFGSSKFIKDTGMKIVRARWHIVKILRSGNSETNVLCPVKLLKHMNGNLRK